MKKRPFLLVLLALAFLTATLLPGPTARAAFGQTPDQAPPADTAGGRNYSSPAIEWHSIIFGQSTNQTDNSIAPQADGSIVISSLNGKGKVTGAHDGIAFYYVTIDPRVNNFALTADIEVLTYANDNDPSKPKPNNQEAFGIMVRDTVGAAGDSSVSASNMVYAGGYRGQLQAVMRENVEESSGYGAKIAATPLDQKFPAKGSTYRLRVRKTNTGYHLAVSPSASLNAGAAPEVVFYRPGLMQVQDKTRLYAGFFAARNASIKVSGITLDFSDPHADPPPESEPVTPKNPELSLLSPAETSALAYNLIIAANVNGTAKAAIGGATLFEDETLVAGKETARIIRLSPGENTIDIAFAPTAPGQQSAPESQNAAGPAGSLVSKRVKITVKSYGLPGGTLAVSPTGKPEGDGSPASPLDIYTATKYALPGQRIELSAGTYRLNTPLVIARGNDGTADAPKTLSAPDGAILSFEYAAPGISLAGDYWVLSGISVTASTSTGIRVAGSHNRVQNCTAYGNRNTGIQISGSSQDARNHWPAFNLVSGCVSRDNRDLAESDADGFAAKLTAGEGNAFVNCVAHHNCDDGWDLYTKLETGAIGAVTIERCVAYGNGAMSDGTKTRGDGNGFKLGGEGIAVSHIVLDCLSYANKAAGFTSNSNPALRMDGAVSADNGGANFVFSVYPAAGKAAETVMNGAVGAEASAGSAQSAAAGAIGTQAAPSFVLARLYSVRTAKGAATGGADAASTAGDAGDAAAFSQPSAGPPSPADIYSREDLSESTYVFDGVAAANSLGTPLDPGIFVSLEPPAEVAPGIGPDARPDTRGYLMIKD